MLLEADIALLAKSDPPAAERLAREALALARRIADAGVEVVALAILGSALVAAGAVDEGVRRLDECAALAVGEEFAETAAPGWALCHTVSACADVGDFGRAEQWCRALHTWSAEWQARHFFGICRTAYGEVLATSGDWPSAEQELVSAMEDLRTTRPALAAPTAVRLGRLRVRQGDLAEARALFEAALPLPQAILALGELDLAAGDAPAAADAADRVLRRLGDASVLDRLPALELLARARAAAGDGGRRGRGGRRGGARGGAAGHALHARARTSRARRRPVGRRRPRRRTSGRRGRGRPLRRVLGALRGGRGADAAVRGARRARPPGAGRGGGTRRGRRAGAARRAGEGRGAERRAQPARGRHPAARGAGLSDAQIAERLFLSPHTVHRHIANIRTKLRVPSRSAAVAHATRHGLL